MANLAQITVTKGTLEISYDDSTHDDAELRSREIYMQTIYIYLWNKKHFY